jgi:hypothetical protein
MIKLVIGIIESIKASNVDGNQHQKEDLLEKHRNPNLQDSHKVTNKTKSTKISKLKSKQKTEDPEVKSVSLYFNFPSFWSILKRVK